MKKSLFLVICLLSLAIVIASVQISKATITNATSISVHATGTNFLTVKPIKGIGNKDDTCISKNDYLEFNFAKGLGNKLFGFQKNSTYIWNVTEKTDDSLTDGLFEIGQILSQDIKVKIEAVDIPTGVSIFFKLDKPSWDTSTGWIELNQKNNYTLDAIPLLKKNDNDAIGVAVKLCISDDAVCNDKISHMQIIISSEVLNDDNEVKDSPNDYDVTPEPSISPSIQTLPHTK